VDVVRGGVYYAELPGIGDKTVLVVSWNAINSGLRSPIVCQITTTDRERALPTYVALAAGDGGLREDSYVLCHELVTLDADDFRRQLGVLSPASLLRVEAALRAALDLS
jgi:mRNA-degrading endonuclease toxin of MazEF toxin-antitoxin module